MLKKCFTLAGFTVYTAETCDEAIKLASQYHPECFLFDYHFGADTITNVCRFIRSHDRLKNAPIVMLSGDAEQAVYGYDSCQVDIFLEKGGSCYEILAAMKRLLRRTGAASGLVRGSDLTLDSKNMCILRAGKPDVSLSLEQFRFFSVLLERSQRFVSEEEMCRQVFAADFTEAKRKALNMVAYRLRIKLGIQLARRIKNSKAYGWVYIQPRNRHKCEPAVQKTSFLS